MKYVNKFVSVEGSTPLPKNKKRQLGIPICVGVVSKEMPRELCPEVLIGDRRRA